MTRFAVPVVVSLVLGLLVGVPAATAAEPAAYACRQDIHPQDEDFPGVHVATLEQAPNGDLLYGFYAGSREGADDVKTYMGRLDAGAATWTAPTVVFDEPDQPDGNAVFWTDDQNDLVHLLFSTIRGDGWTEADLRMITSEDNGRTWSEPRFIREEWGWLFGTLPFRMSNGELIVPIYSETEWSSGWYISTDDAQTFTPYPSEDDTTWPTSMGGMIQPATVELEEGHLLAYNRSRDRFIWKTESFDYGRTWSDAQPTTMPNNNSRLALLKLHNGNLVMGHNPTMFGRSPLRLSLSTDGGATWSSSVDVEAEEGEEFSYPYLLQTSDGMIQLGYTHRRETMRHIAFNEQFIVEGADIPSNPDPAVKAEFADGELVEVQTCRYAVNPQLAPPTACPPDAVPSAGYRDTGESVHSSSIDCVSWHGIALGTSDDSYAPAQHVDRAQMASFLARLIERAGGELPQVSDDRRFEDVDERNVHGERIEQLAEAGIVSGTSDTTYDPDGAVTRAQMATFLVRSYEFVAEQSVPGSRDHFTDDDGNDHEDNINRAVSAGFAAGFADGSYRPGERTRRDQMATYLTNTLERFAREGRVEQP